MTDEQPTKQSSENAHPNWKPDSGLSPISGVAPPVHGRWKPGQSGNPGGRPKKKPMTEALIRILNKLNDAEGEDFTKALFMKAAQGDVAAFKEIADRVEGKVAQPIGGAGDLPDLKIQAITRTIIEPALVEDKADELVEDETDEDTSSPIIDIQPIDK